MTKYTRIPGDYAHKLARARMSEAIPFSGVGLYRFLISGSCEGHAIEVHLREQGRYILKISGLDCNIDRSSWVFRGWVLCEEGSGPKSGDVEGFIDLKTHESGWVFLTGSGSEVGKLEEELEVIERDLSRDLCVSNSMRADALRRQIAAKKKELRL